MDSEDAQKDRDRSRRGDRPSRFSDLNPSGNSGGDRKNRIFVSNIPYQCKWSDVKDLFRKHVGDVTYVELFNNLNDEPRGCGVVEFSNAESVVKAMEVMHRFPLHDRKLIIKEDFLNERDKNGRVINGGGSHRMGNRDSVDRNIRSNDNWSRNSGKGNIHQQHNVDNTNTATNTYGLSAQFLESIGIHGPLLNRLFVANLYYNVNKKKLKEIFKMAGRVRNIDLSTDKEGRSRGFAIVEYEHPVEAVQAISMFDNQVLYDRNITVRMDRGRLEKQETRLPEGLKGIGLGLGPNGEPQYDIVHTMLQNNTNSNSAENGLLGALPSGLALGGCLGGGLGGNMGGGLNASLGNNLGLQALGFTGLSSLQSQLLQQGLTPNNLNTLTGAVGLASNALAMGSMQDMAHVQNSQMNNAYQGGGMGNMMQNSMPQNNMPQNNMPQTNMAQNNAQMMALSFPPPSQRNTMAGRGQVHEEGQNKALDMVVVRHLPPSVSWQLLQEKFGEAGEVKFVEIIDKETALVRFDNNWSASRAIKLFDRTRIEGRTISVRNFEV